MGNVLAQLTTNLIFFGVGRSRIMNDAKGNFWTRLNKKSVNFGWIFSRMSLIDGNVERDTWFISNTLSKSLALLV